MNNPYLLDDKPVSVTDLVQAAQRYEDDESGFYTTSDAARILRNHGHTVTDRRKTKGAKE
jgi:hypothetical protein